MSEEEAQNKVNKFRIGFAILVVATILFLSMVFFWQGNITYGVLMIGIPVVSLIVSTCCYMTDKNEDDNTRNVDFVFDPEADVHIRRANPMQDLPPSYRMTWRRSFIKRFKAKRESQVQNEAITNQTSSEITSEVQQIQEETRRLSNDNTEETRRLSNENTEVTADKETSLNISEEIDTIPKLEEDEINTVEINGIYPKASVAAQESLPTYNEAIVIMRSRENLS